MFRSLCLLLFLTATIGRVSAKDDIHFVYQRYDDSLGITRHPLLVKARSAYDSRQFEAAIKFSETALLKLDSIRETGLVVFTRLLLGSCYTKIRSFDKALPKLKAALVLSQTLRAHHYLIADCHYHLGVYFDMTGNREETIRHHSIALERRIAFFGPDHLKVAESYNGLGEVYTFIFFDYRKAIAFYEKSIRIREKHLAPDAHELYAGYYNLSQAYRMLEDGDKALSYAFKALAVVTSRKEFMSLLEKCYMLLGNIYAGRLDYDRALEYFRKGMEQSILVAGPENFNLILSYTSLGLAYGEMNQLRQAISCFKKSNSLYALHKGANSGLLASNLLHLGRMFQKAGNYDSAKYFLKRNLDVRLASLGPKNKRVSDAYGYLAKFFQEFGQMDSAAFYIQKALIAGMESFDNPDVHANPTLELTMRSHELFELFADKGSILLDYYRKNRSMQSLLSAMDCFKISDALMELNRREYHQEGAKLFFADHYHHIYEEGLKTAYQLFQSTGRPEHFETAVRFMEKSKAILLAESLNNAEIFSNVGLPDSVREKERNLSTALATYRNLLESQPTASQDKQMELELKVSQIASMQEKLRDTIALLYPSYFQIKYQEISGLHDIQSYLSKNDAAMIEYFWGDEQVFVVGLSGNHLVLKQVTDVDGLTNNIEEYFGALQRIPAGESNSGSIQSFYTNARRIYDQLVAPVLTQINAENLIIIRDGPLLQIPFESLPVSEVSLDSYQALDYMLRHYKISYGHSADLLLKAASQSESRSLNNEVLAFSFSSANTFEQQEVTRSGNELPGAASEIAAIAQVLPGKFLLGDEATEHQFKSLAPNYDILHLAVHGRSDPEKQFSGTLFFKDTKDDQEDGQLHVYELYDLALKARLAVLSACESGVGKIFRGEGVFSIARGFAYAGCPSTVMTLWPVGDLASAQIMSDFYTALSKGNRIDVALRKAKLEYLENADPQLAHPAYWAAYIPAGSMEPVVATRFPLKIFWVALALVVALLSLYIARKVRKPLPHKNLTSASHLN